MRPRALLVVLILGGCPDPPRTESRPIELAESAREALPTATRALRYPDVADVFVQHCDKCHHAAKSDNHAAMRVFDSSSYPFSTERPDTLVADLREMFVDRSSLTDAERTRALRWIDGGALDVDGNKPTWRK